MAPVVTQQVPTLPAAIDTSRGALTETSLGSRFSLPIQENGAVLARLEYATYVQGTMTASNFTNTHGNVALWINGNLGEQYQVCGVACTQGTASASLTLQVEVCTGTTAMGSGVNQLTGTVSMSGTANTPTYGTAITTPTVIPIGGRVNLIFGGSETSLAAAVINVLLQRIS